MNSSSRQITILALALPLAFLLSIAGASGAPPSTPSLCQTSDYPALCARIARPLSSVTPETLANASINAAATKAMQARATAARLVYSVHDPAMRQALGVCRTAYSDALDSLRIAGGAIKSHGKGDVMINLSAAVHNVASCEDNFKMQVQGAAFPLRRVNTSLMRLVQELKETMKGAGMPWPGDEGELRWEQAWMAIKKVWASKWNERAHFSTRKVKLDHDYLCMAVLIQEVVSADYAFVIHTANPSTGDPSEIYAEVVKGLGETLVGAYPGRALSFVCRKNDLDSPKLLGYPSKPVGLFIRRSIIFRSDSNGEDLEGYAGAGLYDSVPMDEEEKLVLANDPLIVDPNFRKSVLRSIAKVGNAVEELYGSPQDIEGVVKDGKIFVVQTRPQM